MRSLIWLGIIAALTACSPVKKAEQLVAEVRAEFIPDKRVAWYEIEAVKSRGLVLRGETSVSAARQALVERMQEAGISFIDSILLLPDPALQGREYGLVNVSVCNIRSRPAHSAELATQALMGTSLRVLGSIGSDWYLVQTPDQYLGWLDAGAFLLLEEEEYLRWVTSEKVVFTDLYGTLTLDGRPISDLVAGCTLLAISGQEGQEEVSVKMPDGRMGRVASQLVRPLKPMPFPHPDSVLAAARQFLGIPYLWGGTSAKGFDCSGFTKTAYLLNGVVIPRDASQQVHAGVEVATDSSLVNLQPGDLLFFGRKTPERITHVAFYLGNGEILHTAGSGVVIQSLRPGDPHFAPERYQTFVRARRYLPGSAGLSEVGQ